MPDGPILISNDQTAHWIAGKDPQLSDHPEELFKQLLVMRVLNKQRKSLLGEHTPTWYYQWLGDQALNALERAKVGHYSIERTLQDDWYDGALYALRDWALSLGEAVPNVVKGVLGEKLGDYKSMLDLPFFPGSDQAWADLDIPYMMVAQRGNRAMKRSLIASWQYEAEEFHANCLSDESFADGADLVIEGVCEEYGGARELRKLDAGGIVRANAGPFPASVRNGVKADGSIEIAVSQSAFIENGTSVLDSITAKTLSDTGAFIDQINTDQFNLDLHSWSGLPADAPKRKEQEEQAAEFYTTSMAALHEGGQLLSGVCAITRYFDPKAADDMQRVGGCVLDAAGAAVEFATLAAQFGTSAATANPVGMVVATVNLVSTMMALFGVLDAPEPPPDPVLEQVKSIRNDIAKLGEHLDARLDRIDQGLNVIYGTLVEQFNTIEITQQEIKIDLARIQEALAEQMVTLRRIEDRMTALMKTEARRPLHKAIDDGVAYEQRKRRPMPLDIFETVTDVFHNYAVDFAYDPIEVGLETPEETARILNDDNLAAELDDAPLHENVHTLNRYFQARGWPPLFKAPAGSKGVPNPYTWALAASAYAQVVYENPQHTIDLLKPLNTLQIASGGHAIESSLAEARKTGRVLYAKLVENYAAKVSAFADALVDVGAAWMHDFAERLGHATTNPLLDLWGDPEQPLAYQPPGMTAIHYGSDALAVPDSVIAAVPAICRTRDWLAGANGGRLGLELDAEWKNVHLGPAPGPRQPRPKIGDLYLAVSVTFGDAAPDSLPTVLVRRAATFGSIKMGDSNDGDDELSIAALWPHYRPLFDQKSSAQPLTPAEQQKHDELIAGLKQTVPEMMRDQRIAFYTALAAAVIDQSDDGAALTVAGRRLTGARRLIAATTAINLARAYNGDDQLRSAVEGPPPTTGGCGIPDSAGVALALQVVAESEHPVGVTAVAKRGPSDLHAWMVGLADSACKPFSALVASWYDKLDAGDYTEYTPLVHRTLGQLDLLRIAYQEEDDIVSALPDLGPGANSTHKPDIRRLQGLLRAATPTLTDSKLAVDGTYGSKTTAQVKAAQRKFKLPQTGNTDEALWRALLGVKYEV